jgi:hypothetical protein
VSYEAVSVFWAEPTDRVRLGLRRYVSGSDDCPVDRYHHALVMIGEAPAEESEGYLRVRDSDEYAGDPRWPAACSCGHPFDSSDTWQVWQDRIYRSADGREWALRDLPPGAMFDAHWAPAAWKGPDDISLVVVLPNGHSWHVDTESSNCTRKGESHSCWVRHGDPRTGQMHVDKDGDTCAAGAGSIASGDYHGFLHHGALTAG